MQFNSYDYILFLPVLVCVYFILNRIKFPQLLFNESKASKQLNLGKIALIAGSCFFYAFGDISVLKVLLISIAVNYIFARLITLHSTAGGGGTGLKPA